MIADRNVMIRASAGTGKTYQLTNRYVELLAEGARPERIVALTFTRKAAGEFFDEILKKLARAAEDPDFAGRLAREVGRPGAGRGDFLAMLRTVVEAMPRLRLGTLDSFFARIVRAFPFELGLTGDFRILEEHEAGAERRRTLRGLFAGEGETQARRDFVEGFKRSTFGEEGKRFEPLIDGYLREHHEIFLAAPDADAWGSPGRIWPGGSEWLGDSEPDRERAAGRFREWLARTPMADGQRRRWDAFLAALDSWTPGSGAGEDLKYVMKKLLEPDAWAAATGGRAELVIERRKQDLDRDACRALVELAKGVVRGVLTGRLDATRGVHAVLRGYEAHYEGRVRRAGKLTFGDMRRVLEPLSQTQGAGRRLDVDYRLDGGIGHWLLDEFQDTSRGEWNILRNLIDEAIQDGQRTFFCVGDVKQSIFAWRGGDPLLFREILRHYNAAAETVVEKRLDASRRSGPAVIGMVNAVFGNGGTLSRLFPGAAGETWNAEWRPHTSAVPDRIGQAALLHAGDGEERWSLALRLLAELRPHERGLSCAVLVRRNKDVLALADHLRREGGLPAVSESDAEVCRDNPLGAALLSLFQAAAHPGDGFAREHLRMTPLGRILDEEGLGEPGALSARVLGQVHRGGFERAAEAWLRKLEGALDPGDRFSRQRAGQFAEAAGLFDATGSRNVDEFRAFMESRKVRDPEAAGTIRIMTIHKSKGLGFDLVILPELEGDTLLERRRGLAVERSGDRSVSWILDLPPEPFRSADPVLARHVERAEAEGCYENLSLFYVAMTRAKRGLYALCEPAKAKSTSMNFPRLLAETLGWAAQPVRVGALTLEGAWSSGDPDWIAKLGGPRPKETPRRPMAPLDPALGVAPRHAPRRPSAERRGTVAAARLFAPESAADYGVAVHALLARVEWVGAGEPAFAGAAEGPATDEARACLEAPELAELWSRPAGGGEAWRERPFEVVLGDEWVTGKFDRVVVARGPDGRPSRAVVYDFKTDRLEPGADLAAEARRHAGQLNWYRRAAAALTGLSAEAVECEVVFTRARRRVRIRA